MAIARDTIYNTYDQWGLRSADQRRREHEERQRRDYEELRWRDDMLQQQMLAQHVAALPSHVITAAQGLSIGRSFPDNAPKTLLLT